MIGVLKMKIYCFDRDSCAHTNYLSLEKLQEYNLEQPFIACPECNKLAAIVKDDFSLNDDNQNLFIAYLKLLEKEKKNNA